jgi:hypothetical protein
VHSNLETHIPGFKDFFTESEKDKQKNAFDELVN